VAWKFSLLKNPIVTGPDQLVIRAVFSAMCRAEVTGLNGDFKIRFMPKKRITAKQRSIARRQERQVGEDDTPTRLLRAAREIFSEVGYQAATIREISERAGTNIALVNYHFGDKLELYVEVMRQAVNSAENKAIHDALKKNAPPEEVLRNVVRAMLQKPRANGASQGLRMTLLEFAEPTPALSRIVDEAVRPVHNRLLTTVGAILGLPADHETTLLCTHSILSQIVHFGKMGLRHRPDPLLALLWPGLEMTSARLDQIADHITDFSLAYLRSVAAKQKRLSRGASGHQP